jgi:hypothetical protein
MYGGDSDTDWHSVIHIHNNKEINFLEIYIPLLLFFDTIYSFIIISEYMYFLTGSLINVLKIKTFLKLL